VKSFELRWSGASVMVVFEGARAHVDVRVSWKGRWLVVRDELRVTLPKTVAAGRGFDGRGDGLWLSLVCETPGEHWTVGMEAFALAVDDPDDERGDRVPLGLDIEWGAPGWVFGDVLVDDERWEVGYDADEPAELVVH